MEDTAGIKPLIPGKPKDLDPLAKKLGINLDDADTLVTDIIPMLKRKYDLRVDKLGASASKKENDLKILLDKELPRVLSNYGLVKLRNNKAVLIHLVKEISPDITDLRAKQFVDLLAYQSTKLLADELASQLGIRSNHLNEFQSKIIPRLKKYTKTMYQKKLDSKNAKNDMADFKQFVIDNVFIDEFENHPFIRTATDKNNRAILLPKAKKIALKMISAWMIEVRP
ncbi:MAG: hypothetical protein PVI06_18365 [Desulfobacterales bacterium]|jgi:hypothetical protein